MEALAHFSQRKGITVPLLSDSDSKIIRSFGVLNTEIPQDNANFGIPHPGTFLVDREGVIRSKFFEKAHSERQTFRSILARGFDRETSDEVRKTEGKHLEVKTYASQETAYPGNRLTLILEGTLPPKTHVYAPGVEGYIPVELKLEPSQDYHLHETMFPESKILHLPVIEESVPVYEGSFRVLTDITLAGRRDLREKVRAGESLVVEGTFRYQACDDKECYIPEQLPVRWSVNLLEMDRGRVPENMRHKAKSKN